MRASAKYLNKHTHTQKKRPHTRCVRTQLTINPDNLEVSVCHSIYVYVCTHTHRIYLRNRVLPLGFFDIFIVFFRVLIIRQSCIGGGGDGGAR